jgi:hypothetical protein
MAVTILLHLVTILRHLISEFWEGREFRAAMAVTILLHLVTMFLHLIFTSLESCQC